MAKPRARTPQVVGTSAPLGRERLQLPQLPGLKCPGCLSRITYIEKANAFQCQKCGGRFTTAQIQRHVEAMAQVTAKRRQLAAEAERAETNARDVQARQDAAEAKKGYDTSVVYFIRFRDAVKVGTTTDLITRMSELPWEEVVGIAPGGIHCEVKHHRNLRPYRIHGEWFEMTNEVAAYIGRVNDDHSDWYSEVFRVSGPLPLQRGVTLPALADYPAIT